MLRLVFHLAQRQAEAFAGSVLRLLGLDLFLLDHTTLSRELKANPEVTAVANAWDDGTLGAAAPNTLAPLRDGWVQADVAQMLYREGYEGVKIAIAAARGEPVPARIDTGHQVVTSENLDRFIAE